MVEKPFVIGISGISGAGKTHILGLLQEALGSLMVTLPFDDYYLPKHLQAVDDNGYLNFDLPSALDYAKFAEDLRQLCFGNPILVTRYQFELEDAPQVTELLEPAPILVAEGLFVFELAEIDMQFDLRVFVDADMDANLLRRLQRDAAERGIPEERSLYQWQNHVLPAWNEYIEPHRKRCDLVLHNNHSDPPDIHNIIREIRGRCSQELASKLPGL